MNYARLSRRFFALYFDSCIVAGIVSTLLLFLKMFDIGISFEGILEGDFSYLSRYYALFFFVYLAYEIVFLISPLSSTPGKIILGQEVVSYESSFLKVIIRSIVKVIGAFSALIYISGLVAAFNEKKQSIHDLLAKTFVTDLDRSNRAFSSNMDSSEFHEEMKKRGIKTYSQQQALAEEMFGKARKANNNLLMNPLLWVIVLIISIVIGLVYSRTITSEIQKLISASLWKN